MKEKIGIVHKAELSGLSGNCKSNLEICGEYRITRNYMSQSMPKKIGDVAQG